jgi:hypothetical protein
VERAERDKSPEELCLASSPTLLPPLRRQDLAFKTPRLTFDSCSPEEANAERFCRHSRRCSSLCGSPRRRPSEARSLIGVVPGSLSFSVAMEFHTGILTLGSSHTPHLRPCRKVQECHAEMRVILNFLPALQLLQGKKKRILSPDSRILFAVSRAICARFNPIGASALATLTHILDDDHKHLPPIRYLGDMNVKIRA